MIFDLSDFDPFFPFDLSDIPDWFGCDGLDQILQVVETPWSIVMLDYHGTGVDVLPVETTRPGTALPISLWAPGSDLEWCDPGEPLESPSEWAASTSDAPQGIDYLIFEDEMTYLRFLKFIAIGDARIASN